MEEPHSILPTLEHLLEHLLDLEQQVRVARKLWHASLEVNQPLQQEVAALDLLIADCKTAMLEFLPAGYTPISVRVQDQLYFISKNVEGKAPALIIRPQD